MAAIVGQIGQREKEKRKIMLAISSNQSLESAVEELELMHAAHELTGEELTKLTLQQEQQDRLSIALAETQRIFKQKIRTTTEAHYTELARSLKEWTEKVLSIYGSGKYALRIEGLIETKDDFIRYFLGIPGKTYRNWFNGTKQAPGIKKIGISEWAQKKAGIDTQGRAKKESIGKMKIADMDFDEVTAHLQKAQTKLTSAQTAINECQARLAELVANGLVKPAEEPTEEPAAQASRGTGKKK